MKFRIERDRDGLHANPDERTQLKHRLTSTDLALDISNFNVM